MPTGDVEPNVQNLGPWFNAGVFSVGMGAKLITAEIIAQGDFATLSVKCKESIEIISRLKKK